MEKEKFLKKLKEDNKQLENLHKNWIELAKAQQFIGIIFAIVILIILFYEYVK